MRNERTTSARPPRRARTFVVVASTLLLSAVSVLACDSAAEPDPEELSATVERLASPRFDGRMTGSSGNEEAARMLADRLAASGARPLPGESGLLFRHEQAVVRQLERPAMTVTPVGGEALSFEPGVDFTILIREGTSPAGPVDAELLVLDGDRASPAWIESHPGAALLVDAETFSTISRDATVMEALFASDHGPAAIVLSLPAGIESLPRGLYLTADDYPRGGPVLIQMSHEAAERLPVDATPRGAGQSESVSEASVTLSIRGGYEVERTTVSSVAALVHDGGSPDERTPPVIVSAHFDGPGRISDAWHYPGAVDNASGVAVALELARLIAESRAPDRPVWVVLFNGEEQGMRGSLAFVDAFADRLRDARVINVDMVGQANTAVTVTVNPDAGELGDLAKRRLVAHGLEAVVREGGGSDHGAFAGLAPAISLVQAPYEHMHRRGDVPANVDPDVLVRIAAAVYDLVGP